jgi:hypothetical protein
MCDNHEADEALTKALLGMTPSAGITRRHLFGLLGVVGEWTSKQVGTGGSGTVTADVTQTSSAFFCAQVVNSSGTPIATGNPSVFLTAEPPRGIPADRRVN